MPDRPFSPPCSSEEHSGYFVVRDRHGQALSYVYFENDGRRLDAIVVVEIALNRSTG
jgi:hypothetical protein